MGFPNRSVDVFVCLRSGDLSAAAVCVESISAHINRDGGRLIVVASVLAAGSPHSFEQLGCEYLNPVEICGFESTALPGVSAAKEHLFFEIIKWELRRFAKTPTYLVIDSDCALTGPTDLWSDHRPVQFCENRFRFGYLMCFNWLFGQYPYPTSPASGKLMHMDRSVVDEMVAKIEARYKVHWAQAVIAILRQVKGTAFNAGQNYGHYVAIFRPGSFAVADAQVSVTKPVYEVPTRAGSSGDDSGSLAYPRDRLREEGVVRMGSLGFNGRFANQIFQYAYLKLYAQRESLRAECPPWIGCSLFGHQASMGEDELPIYRENKGHVDEMIRFDPHQRTSDVEIWGYFQDPAHWVNDREAFRGLFQPLPFVKNPLDEAIDRLKAGNKTLVAIHLRRGDFTGGSTFWPAPEAWYLDWLKKVWPTLADPVLYVATDDAKNVLPKFTAYAPKSAVDLNVTVNGAEFYSDFYVLSQCDLLGISNSTFSFAAAMMNKKASTFARPDATREKMVVFDPWNSPVQLQKPVRAAIAA